MFKDVKDKLNTAIGCERFRYIMIFLNVSVEGLSNLFRFYSYSENYISYLSKIINKDKNILIDDFYIGT